MGKVYATMLLRRALAHITPKPTGVDHLHELTKPFPDARLALAVP